MKPFTLKVQKGIGLIEVLITAIVIAVGLLAVAAMQTGFMASSGDSKTRSEALALAEQKIEQLRNNITVNGYNAQIAATNSDTVTGTNANFARSWAITAASLLTDANCGGSGQPPCTNAPNRKKISAIVSWDSDGGADSDGDGKAIDQDEKVNVVSEIAFLDPAKSALYAGQIASGGSMAVPNPRQNASEDVASENVDATRPTPLPGSVTVRLISGALPSTTITATGDGGASFSLTPITSELPATHYYSAPFGDGSGIIAVYLCTENDSSTATCKYIQNHFGGVPLRIAGTVYSTSRNHLDDIRVAWSSSEVHYCYNGRKLQYPSSGSTQYHYMAYECVFAGNCNATADGVNNCYPDTAVSDSQINARNVGPGGEYGELGLIGVDDSGGDREQVCFLEDTTDPSSGGSPLLQASGSEVLNEHYLYAVTKRSYVTRRIQRNSANTGNEQISEGINRSYTNHNFLIVDRGSGGTANAQCYNNATAYSLVLAPRQIIRTLTESGQPNQVVAGMAYNGSFGTAKHLIGNVLSNASNLKLYIPETGACYLNNNLTPSTAATQYACVVPSNAPLSAGVSILGGSYENPTSSPSGFATCTKTTSTILALSTCAWPF